MGQRAKVTSIDAVGDFAAALRCFQHEASDVLESLQLGIHRIVQWIQQDQKQYWTHQLRVSERQLQEAKLNLQRCLTFKRIGHHRPSCIEEKRAVERAKRRERLCREKLEAVRKWSRAIGRAIFEYRTGVGHLAHWLEADAERAVGLLGRIRRTLEDYVAAEASPELAEALARLPWTDAEGEGSTAAEGEEEEKVAEEESPEKAASATDATDDSDSCSGNEHGSDEGACHDDV